MDVTTTTVYENVQSPIKQLRCELSGSLAEELILDESNKENRDRRAYSHQRSPRRKRDCLLKNH